MNRLISNGGLNGGQLGLNANKNNRLRIPSAPPTLCFYSLLFIISACTKSSALKSWSFNLSGYYTSVQLLGQTTTAHLKRPELITVTKL